MKIVAFYSFKGGVGRTSALLNVGYLLATRRLATVALADWDIHAPGLTCLEDLRPTEEPLLRPGVVDILASLADAKPDGDVLDPGDLVHATPVGRRIAEASGGELWLVPAGAFDPAEEESEFLTAVQTLQPKIQGLARVGQGDLVTWFGERVAAGFKEKTGKELDYLLLDARTGLTEVGDLLLSDATDQVVLLFGLNAQNQIGMEQTLRQLVGRFGSANMASRVLLVASPIPAGEEAIKARRLAAARAKITSVVEELTTKESAGDRNPITPAAPRLLTIPYHPLLALEEAIFSEHYPESDLGRAFAAIEDAVRISDKHDVAVSKAILASVVERVQEERPSTTKGAVRGENPFARLLRWNVVQPEATAERLAGNVPEALREPLLQGLANSAGVPEEERAKIVDALPKLSVGRIEELARTFQEEQRTWREAGTSGWPILADLAGKSWATWALLSAERLKVDSKEATRRLLEGWPCRLDGEVGVRAALSALDVLTAKSAITPEIPHGFLSSLRDKNQSLDLALGGVAANLIYLGEIDSARPLFEQATALPPSETAFTLALRLQTGGTRLLPQRQAEGLLLLEQAGQHYARALALKPDMHGAESNWGNALSSQAQAVSGRDLEKALGLWEEAGQHHARALTLKPDMPEAESNWGTALSSQAKAVSGRDLEKALGLWEQAGQHHARVLALKPDMHEAESNWGAALNFQAQAVSGRDLEKALGLWEQAGQHYARVLALKPDMHEAESNFIVLELMRYHALRGAGRDAEAQAVAKHALEIAERLGARTGKPSYNLACALCINGRTDEALDLLESLHKSSDLSVDAAHLAADPDLASLAEHPRFQTLLTLLRASSPRSGE